MQIMGSSLPFGIQLTYSCFAESKCELRSLLDKVHIIYAIIAS